MPDVFDEVATQSAPKDVFDEIAGGKKDIFDEVAPSFSPQEVTDAAQNSATVAQQALDVATLPAKLDWAAANEQLDAQRLYEARSAEAAAKLAEDQGSGTGPGSEAFRLRREAQFQREQMAGGTQAARQVRGEDINALRSIEEAGTTAERPSTPASALSSILGPGLSANVQPVVEAAGRNVGGATGGALGAALGAAATAGTGGVFPLLYGLAGAFLGSQAGGAAQEGVLSATETPEETAARHQRTAEDIAANPGAAHVGAALATAPFFGPSLAQFGRAAAGDSGAILNLGLAGGIGAGMEVIGAKMRGESAKPEDIAAAIFTNIVMNKPTRLGQAIGLHPSSEEALTKEAETKYRELPPLPFEVKGETGISKIADLAPEGILYRSEKTSYENPGEGAVFFSGDKSYMDLYHGEGRVVRKVPVPENVLDIRTAEDRNQMRTWVETKIAELENSDVLGIGNYIRGAKKSLEMADSPQSVASAMSNISLAMDKIAGTKITPGRAEKAFMTDAGVDAITWPEYARREGDEFSIAFRENPTATNENAQQISETSAPDGGVRASEVPLKNEPLPADESGQGVQPSGQGGSVAENAPEAPREVGDATSIKNAVTAEERAAREIPPVEEPARREFGQVWDAVKAEVADNPAAPDVLISELKGLKRPRALTDREDALLLHRQVDLQRSYDDAAAEVNRAAEAGDEPARAEAATKLDATRDALQELYDIGKRGGTETARGLAARKMMANQDFTLAAMETRLRAEQGGERLSAEQQAKVKEQADTIARTQAEMEKIIAERDALKAAAEAAKKEDATVDPKVRSLADRIIARLDVTAANAAKSLRSRLVNLNNFVPDPLIIADVAKIAAAKTAKKAIQFAQWSAEMIQEFGEKVRPFLQAGWDQRDQHIDAEVNGAVRRKAPKARTDAEKEASAVKARLTALANRTAKLQERTAKGDFSPMRKPQLDLSKNPEWVKLKAENDTAKAAYEKARYEARKAQRSTQQKVGDTIKDTWAASRPILASTDFSAPGRQGIFFTLPDLFTNQVRLGQQLRKMFRSQFNERKFQENEAAIKSRENADLYDESGLYIADLDHKPSAREEQFKSELAERIPVLGRIVRGSARGFTAFMNTVRADAMDAFVNWAGGKENLNPETRQFLATAINDLTGRGHVPRATAGFVEGLAKYFFSPRLWVSRLNTAILRPIWRQPFNRQISLRARAVVFGQYAKFLGAVYALKFLVGLNGGKMEEDPRDSDFGKIQYGTKRFDVMGGIGNMTTLLARVFSRTTKDDKGKVLRLAWMGEKRPEREMGQVIFNHMRNKMAPIPGAIYDYIYGRHPDRSKVTAGSLLKQTTVPITVSDTAGYFKNDNPASALKDTLLNAFGITVNDYRK